MSSDSILNPGIGTIELSLFLKEWMGEAGSRWEVINQKVVKATKLTEERRREARKTKPMMNPSSTGQGKRMMSGVTLLRWVGEAHVLIMPYGALALTHLKRGEEKQPVGKKLPFCLSGFQDGINVSKASGMNDIASSVVPMQPTFVCSHTCPLGTQLNLSLLFNSTFLGYLSFSDAGGEMRDFLLSNCISCLRWGG